MGSADMPIKDQLDYDQALTLSWVSQCSDDGRACGRLSRSGRDEAPAGEVAEQRFHDRTLTFTVR